MSRTTALVVVVLGALALVTTALVLQATFDVPDHEGVVDLTVEQRGLEPGVQPTNLTDDDLALLSEDVAAAFRGAAESGRATVSLTPGDYEALEERFEEWAQARGSVAWAFTYRGVTLGLSTATV